MCRSPPSSEQCHLLDTPDVQEVMIAVEVVGCDDRNDSSTSHWWWWQSLFGRHKRKEVVVVVVVDDDADDDDDDDDDADDDGDSRSGRVHPHRRRDEGKRKVGSAIVAGQAIAFALSCANAASSSLANDFHVTIPTLQTGMVYFLLSFRLVHLFRGDVRDDENRQNNHGGDYNNICEHHGDNQQATGSDDMQELQPCSVLGGSSDALPSSHHVGDAAAGQRRPNATAPPHKFPFANLTLHAPWHTYALLAALDVEANYLAMLSFRHTTLSSSMLLTSLSVLSTVALRRLILPRAGVGGLIGGIGGRRRTLGAALCLVGGCSWLRREFLLGGDGGGDAADVTAYGDLLALAAACIYGLNDVLAEYFLKAGSDDGAEYVGMLGLFGAAFSLCVQAPLLGEWDRARILFGGVHDNVAGTESDHRYGGVAGSFSNSTSVGAIALLLLCFVIMLFYFYTSAMAYMSRYDSTSLNLSLQSGPLWAVVLTMIQKSLTAGGNSGGRVGLPPAMFFVSFTLIAAGMFLYESNSENERISSIVEDVGGIEGSSSCSNAKKTKLDKDYGSTELI